MSEEIQKTKKISNFWFWWNLIESLVLLAGGALAITAGVLTSNQGSNPPRGVENAVAYVVASFVILDGLLRIIMFLARMKKGEEQSPLAISGFEISLGILLVLVQTHFADANIFAYMIVNLIAIVMMVAGILLLVYAIYVIAKKMANLFMPIMEILFAAVLAAVGVVIEVLYNTAESRDQLVLILIGTVLSLAAIGMFIVTLITRKKANKEIKKAEKAEQGEYEVAVRKPAKVEEPEPVDIIDAEAEEVPPARNGRDAKHIGGPKALENKDEN